MRINRMAPWRGVVAVVCLGAGLMVDAGTAAASTNQVMSVNDCIGKALAGNPALQAAARRWEAAKAQVSQARVVSNPQFAAEVESFGGSGEYRGWDAAESTFGLSQEIELGGRRSGRMAEAVAEADAARAAYESLKLDLVRDTRKAFLAVLLAEEKRRLAGDAVRLAGEVEATTAARVAAGKTTPLESGRVRVDGARAELARDDAALELESARRRLAALWGADEPGFELPRDALLDCPADMPPLAELLSGLDRTPDAAGWRAAIRAARARLQSGRAARVPNVELSLGVRRFEDSPDTALVAGIAAPLPLFDRNAGGVRAAAAELEAATLDEAAGRAALRLELCDLYGRILNQQKRVAVLKSIGLPAVERAWVAAQAGYREGKTGYLEVLDAQRVYTELRVESVEAVAGLLAALAEVQRFMTPPAESLETE